MKLKQLISEIEFSIYQAMIRVGHSEDITVQDVGEMLRAMPGVKLLTTKPPSEAFASFKNTSIQRIPEVKKVEVAEKTIEKKK